MNSVCISHKHLLFSCYLIIPGQSEVANAAHNTALFVHFKGQSEVWGTFSPAGKWPLLNLFTNGFNGA